MIIKEGRERGVCVQIRDTTDTKGSRSLTIHGSTVQEVYNHVLFLFQRLSEADEKVELTFYKTKKRIEGNEVCEDTEN